MKRGGFLKRRTPLNARGTSDTSVIKEEIQALLRNNLRKAQYDAIVKTIIQLGHVALWKRWSGIAGGHSAPPSMTEAKTSQCCALN
jgi:hypothetical protein